MVLNDLLMSWGLGSWKPLLGALLLPPVPLLVLMLLGAAMLRRRPAAGWTALLSAACGIWLACTTAVGFALQRHLLPQVSALTPAQLNELRAAHRAGTVARTAIVVLGGGRERYAPEYGTANLSEPSMARLRYGLWLARQTALPVAFSGGTGHAQPDGPGEAQVASSIALREFNQPLKWSEERSSDTRENAERSVPMLQDAGVTRIVLVTHGWHMPRAQRAFEQAIARRGGGVTVLAAPMGLASDDLSPPLRWLPSSQGFESTRHALHESLGLLFGA